MMIMIITVPVPVSVSRQPADRTFMHKYKQQIKTPNKTDSLNIHSCAPPISTRVRLYISLLGVGVGGGEELEAVIYIISLWC